MKYPLYSCSSTSILYRQQDRLPSWWRHQMKTFSALLAICAGNSPVPGEFPAQRPVTRSFDVFFSLRLNKRLSKQSWGWWFETLSFPLWRHRNVDKSWQQDNLDCFPWEVLAQKFVTGFWIIFKRQGLPHKFSINHTLATGSVCFPLADQLFRRPIFRKHIRAQVKQMHHIAQTALSRGGPIWPVLKSSYTWL